MYVMDVNEDMKMLETVERIWHSMLEIGCDRKTVLCSIGGGITGDVGGFAASAYMRGISHVQIPTTLLAMVDASIGGKTGVNMKHSNYLLKNMIGSFWQPSLVISDVATLHSLDIRQMRCGLAECVKHGMLGHPEVLNFIRDSADKVISQDADILIELISMSAQIKVDAVTEDEFDSGQRALLNLGHTFGHVIETLCDIYHGEAIAIGLCAAMHCSFEMGLIDKCLVDEVRSLIASIGLPTVVPELPGSVTTQELIARMQSDKKAMGGTIIVILPTDASAIISEVEIEVLERAWCSVGAQIS